jgi:hypothetical protein
VSKAWKKGGVEWGGLSALRREMTTGTWLPPHGARGLRRCTSLCFVLSSFVLVFIFNSLWLRKAVVFLKNFLKGV